MKFIVADDAPSKRKPIVSTAADEQVEELKKQLVDQAAKHAAEVHACIEQMTAMKADHELSLKQVTDATLAAMDRVYAERDLARQEVLVTAADRDQLLQKLQAVTKPAEPKVAE